MKDSSAWKKGLHHARRTLSAPNFNIWVELFASNAIPLSVIYAFGYGFPVHRGGPMFYCDTVGVAYVCKRVSAAVVLMLIHKGCKHVNGAGGGVPSKFPNFLLLETICSAADDWQEEHAFGRVLEDTRYF